MKIIKWVIVATIALIIGYFFNYLALDSDLNWTCSIYEKKLSILRQFKGQKRIIIIGGSGTHYGIDALQIEHELHMPVINMGLHGGLGLNAILGSIRNEISKGDIVVLIPEYGILSDNGTGWLSASFGVAIGHPGFGGVGIEQTVEEIFKGCVLNLTSFGKSMMKIIFNAKGRAFDTVDARGNATIFLAGKASPFKVDYFISDNAKLRLRTFDKEVKNVGGVFLLGLPWVLISENDDEAYNVVLKIIMELRNIAPVLYDNDTLNLKKDPSLFSDTGLHNNEESRSVRSFELAAQLKLVLNSKNYWMDNQSAMEK